LFLPSSSTHLLFHPPPVVVVVVVDQKNHHIHSIMSRRLLPELKQLITKESFAPRASVVPLFSRLNSKDVNKGASQFDALIRSMTGYNALQVFTAGFQHAKYQPGYEDYYSAPDFKAYRSRIKDKDMVDRLEKFYNKEQARLEADTLPSLPDNWDELASALLIPVCLSLSLCVCLFLLVSWDIDE
jgi:hypothetical protein